MSYRRNGLGVLGLLAVVALGVMAFASTAQALTPEFLINKKLALHASVTGEQEGVGSLLVPALNLEINCTEFQVLEGLILNGVDADARLLYKNCTALSISALPTKEELPCQVSDVGGGKPELLHITTGTVLLLPIEFHKKTPELQDFGILADINEFFINFLSGTGCPLPLKNKISGKVCALIEKATNDTATPLILLSEAIQKLEGCEDQLLYGANAAFVDGAAKLLLTGEHKDFLLGVSLL